MKKFTVNGKEYSAKAFDFNTVCDMEDMGVQVSEMSKKPMASVRAYFALCSGSGVVFAGKEMEQHVAKGGVFEEIIAIMDEEIGKSDFFRALRERAEKEDAADQSQKEAEEK